MKILLRSICLLTLSLTLATAGISQGSIKVGEVGSLTGKEAALGQSSRKGTMLAFEEINARGGVLGRRLQLITEDNASVAGESATAAQKLISRDKVIALLGEDSSSRSLEMAPIAQTSRVPMISPASTNPKVTQVGDYIFRICFIDPFQGAVMAKFARESLKLTRVATLVSVSTAYSVGLAQFFDQRFTADGGMIAITRKYSEGDRDFKAQLTAIKAAGVGGIFVPGFYTEAALICLQARELGIDIPIFGGDGWEAPQLIQIGGSAVDGCYFSTHYSPDSRIPASQAFVQRFSARFDGQTPDAMAALGYDSAMILADAIKRAGTTDGPLLRAAIGATKDFPGVTGDTTIDANRNATKPAVIITVRDGKFKFLENVTP